MSNQHYPPSSSPHSNQNDPAIGTAATYRGQWPTIGGEMWNVKIPVAEEETTIVIRPGIDDLRKKVGSVAEQYGIPFPEWPGAKIYPWGAVGVSRIFKRLVYFILGAMCCIGALGDFC